MNAIESTSSLQLLRVTSRTTMQYYTHRLQLIQDWNMHFGYLIVKSSLHNITDLLLGTAIQACVYNDTDIW